MYDPVIEGMKRRRAEISAHLSDIATARARLLAAENVEKDVIAAISDLSRDEIDALRDWARTGEGERPVANVEGRRELNDKLVQAQLEAEAARGVHADLDAEQRGLVGDLTNVAVKIEDAALDRLTERHAAEMRNLDAYIVEHLLPRMALHLAFHGLLIAKARTLQASGDGDRALSLFRRAENLQRSYVQFEATPVPGQVVEKVDTWQKRLDDLMGDEPRNVVSIGAAA